MKRVKGVVFNQDKSRFALVWDNVQEVIKVSKQLDEPIDYAPKEMGEGFTVLETHSMQEVLDFRANPLRQNYNLVLKQSKGREVSLDIN